MKLLLDTPILLWWFQLDKKITKKMADAIHNADMSL